MPLKSKKTFKRKFKRKAYKKKGLTLYNNPVPKTRLAKLRYSAFITLDPTFVGTAIHTFRANDCHDPDYTGSGHQPLFFDQLMAIYKKCYVLGSKITARFVPNNSIMFVNVQADNDTTALGYDALIEQQKAGWKFIPPTATRTAVITKNFSAKKQFHTKDVIANPNLYCTTGASPTEQHFYHVQVGGIAGSDPNACHIHVTIDYICRFTDMEDLPQS